MAYWYIRASRSIHHTLQLRYGRSGNGLVKVMDEKTRKLKRWETNRGKSVAVRENGRLVLTRLGKQLRCKVRRGRLES